MALSTTTNRVSYAGDDVSTGFSFPYYFLANADLVVLITSALGVVTTKTITTHYTVTGAGVAAGGTVTMLTAPATGETLTIYRDPAVTQTLDLVENDALPAESVEEALDRNAMISQRNRELATRSIRLDDGFSGSFSLTLPTDINTSNTVLVVNSTGTGFDVGPTTTDLINAEANAAAAAASAGSASTSAGAASTSAAAAGISETNAAASALAAAANAAAILPYRDVIYVTNADSPITVADTAMGSVYHVDCTSGAVTINLPSIAALDPDLTKSLVIIKTDSSSNVVTIARDGTDTINGDTSLLLEVQYAGANLVADADGSPDDWTGLKFGASGGGGGSTYINWRELSDAPELYEDASASSYLFAAGLGQELYGTFRVPSSYVLGKPISLNILFWSADTTGTALLSSESTLIVPGTDAITSTTNQRTSTNSAVTLSGSTQNIPQTVTLDLTDTSGEINSVAVSPGDLINIRLFRGTDTSTTDLGFLFNDCEVTIS